jgi:outer membrane protein assembly factor BamB
VPELGAGRFLVSFRALDAIGAIDVEAGELVWSLTGSFVAQHHPTVLDRGTILLFDNRGPGDDASAVTELDPLSGAIVWEYRGSEDRPFFSGCCGTAYRLPNGNTLITETDGGRAFEVTEAGETVWEFYNPHRAGEQLEYIASIYDLQRLPADLGREWLGR